MSHTERAKWFGEKYPVGGWWAQMITITYEQQRGLRQKHEKSGGFAIGVMKTIATPVAHLREAWEKPALRKRWLGDAKMQVRKSTPGKSLRITWTADSSSLELNLFEKGPAKSQISVEHSKLKSARQGEKMNKFWAEKLENLKQFLEE